VRAVVYGGGKAETVALPSWVSVTAVCFPHRAEAACSRCGKVVKLDGAKADDERELGRFALWHRRCRDTAEVRRAAARVVGAAPSEEWMRAFERKGEGDG
jgi:hypothetical protein